MFGITKVNGYTLFPRQIISEPRGGKKVWINRIIWGFCSHPVLWIWARNSTNHLLCFYPGGLCVPNRNTSSCRCKPRRLCRLVHTSLPERFLWPWPKDTVLLFSCWSPPLPLQRLCLQGRRYLVHLPFCNPQKNGEQSWWDKMGFLWLRPSFVPNPISCRQQVRP